MLVLFENMYQKVWFKRGFFQHKLFLLTNHCIKKFSGKKSFLYIVFVSLLRSILQPLITAVTIMTLTSLTGLLNITFLLRSNLQLGHNSETTSTAGEIEKSREIENISSSNNNLMDMGYIVAGVNVLVPLFTASLIHRIGQKMFLLVSSGLMAASLLFLTLLGK